MYIDMSFCIGHVMGPGDIQENIPNDIHLFKVQTSCLSGSSALQAIYRSEACCFG